MDLFLFASNSCAWGHDRLEAECLRYQHHCDPPLRLTMNDQGLHLRAPSSSLAFHTRILQWQAVFLDPAQPFLKVMHNLLVPDDQDHLPGLGVWSS